MTHMDHTLFKVTPYDENDPESMFDDAKRMYDWGRYADAHRRFFKVIDLKSDHRLALIYMTKSLIKSGEPCNADIFYTYALELSYAQNRYA